MLCWLIRSLWWLVVGRLFPEEELVSVTVIALYDPEGPGFNPYMLVSLPDGQRKHIDHWLANEGETIAVNKWDLW